MKSKELQDIENLLKIKFQIKQKSFLILVAEENRLRSQLSKIDDQSRLNESSHVHEIRAIGADVAWKSWVDRSKRTLNMELAHILAQKDQVRAKVKNDYGKVLVSGELRKSKYKQEIGTLQRRKLAAAVHSHFRLQGTGKQ
ncbi:MAG: hypothetical protein AB8B62_01505 [Roseobacter sp.]